MPAKYRVQLTSVERADLQSLTRRGTTAARTLTRARALLLADRGLRDREIAIALDIDARTVQRLRRRWAEAGVSATLVDRSRPGAVRCLDGPQEAHLIALACADPPAGRAQWTLRLLAARLIELEVVDTISYETVRRTLKQTT